jgi:amidophosphoribosyltransferase
LVKSNYIGRSFISSKQSEREDIVKRKLNPIAKTVEGKKVAVVDDSIVRGTTSKRIVQILREAGAAEIYFISAAPPLLNPCIYGIDMSVTTELIAANRTVDEIKDYIGADALIYQSLEDLKEQFDEMGMNTCMACLSGDYPTANAELALRQIEEERMAVKAND